MSTATTIIPRAARTYQWSTGQRRSFAQPFPNAFLPSTHWVPAKIPFDANGNEAICRIYPRPDSECNAWARHKWFYYDGTNTLSQVIPLGARGGAWPYVWVIMEAPTAANATIGSVYQGGLPSAQYNGYGDLVVTPTAAFTDELFWIRGYGQDGDFLDFTWTASTTSSTEYFVFGDSVNGLSTNAGTISAPIDGFDTAFTAGKFPNATLVLRGGTYPISNTAGTGQSFNLGSTPGGIMAYPGEAPVIDIANSAGPFAFGWGGYAEDAFFQGLTFVGISNANKNEAYQHLWPGVITYRFVAHNLSFPNVFGGQNAANNSTCIYWSDDSMVNSYSQYIFLKGNSESNRQLVNGQNYGIFCTYGTSCGLAEFNTCINSYGVQHLYLKGSNYNWTRRANAVFAIGGSAYVPLSSGDFCAAPGPSGNIEDCYNLLVNTVAASGGVIYGTRANVEAANFDTGQEWRYRNTLLGAHSVFQATGNGPFSYENDAIEWTANNTGPLYYWSSVHGQFIDTLPYPTGVTISGTACQAASGVLDPNTYELTGTYRTSGLGQYGAEVA